MGKSYGLTYEAQPVLEGCGDMSFSFLRYSAISESSYHTDLGSYNTYGLRVDWAENSMTLHDVSPCRKTADFIAERFNRCQLSWIHVSDALQDAALC